MSVQLKIDYNVLTGDMLLASAFVSYCGPFTSTFRSSLNGEFLSFLKQKGTPMTEGLTDPLKVRATVLEQGMLRTSRTSQQHCSAPPLTTAKVVEGASPREENQLQILPMFCAVHLLLRNHCNF